MTKIILPFNKWSRQKLALKLKQCTTRTHRAGKAGDNFFVGMTEFILTAVMETTLAIVARDFYKEEGCDSPEEFMKVWCELHPINKWKPEQRVFLHWFAELRTTRQEQESCQQLA